MGNEFAPYFEAYFRPGEPVCREERQYTLFLYNRLLAIRSRASTEDRKFLAACGITGEGLIIHSVLYEASFMRDIFWRERADQQRNGGGPLCFNRLLYQFLSKTEEGSNHIPADRNLGGRSGYAALKNRIADIQDEETNRRIEEENQTMKQMMNARPDLAVLYEAGGKKYMKFMECKYLSNEDVYHGGIKQTEIQAKIGRFLCEHVSGLEFAGVQLIFFQSNANARKLKSKKYHEPGKTDVIDLKTLIPEYWQEENIL